MTGKMVTQVEPYDLDPDFERAVVLHTCSSPDFYARVGQYLDPDALGTEIAKLAVRTAKDFARGAGRGPASTFIAMQHLLNGGVATGKVRIEDANAVQTAFDCADASDPEQIIAALAPILQRRLQGASVMLSHDEFARKGDFRRVEKMLTDARAIGAPIEATTDAPLVRRAADIEPEQVEWLWPGRIPLGKITMVDGDPGLGKSTMISADIAARVSTGAPMPSEEDGREAADVLILSAEDGAADTILPRLAAAGAELTRVHIFDPSAITLADIEQIEREIVSHQAKLIVIDPLMAFLPGRTDSHRDQDIRRVMRPLSAVAERTGCAIVLVRHLNKSAGGSAIYRSGGSIGITGAARSVLLVAKDPDNEEQRIVASIKSNLGPPPTALVFTLVSDAVHGCGRVVWCGESTLTADALTAPKGSDTDDKSVVGEAARVLQEILAAGPRPASEVAADAKAAGIATMTLRRAKDRLGVRASKSTGQGGAWYWALPEGAQGAQGAQDAQPPVSEHLPSPQGVQPETDEHLEHLEHLEPLEVTT